LGTTRCRTRAGDSIVHRADLDRLTGVDAIAGDPAPAFGLGLGQAIFDLDPVEAEGGERVADLLRRAAVQGQQARHGEVRVLLLLMNREHGEDVLFLLALDPLHLDLQRQRECIERQQERAAGDER
jgi:hypothetical protein